MGASSFLFYKRKCLVEWKCFGNHWHRRSHITRWTRSTRRKIWEFASVLCCCYCFSPSISGFLPNFFSKKNLQGRKCFRNHWHRLPHINPLKPELNPICYMLALLAHHFLHVSRIRVKLLTFRLLMSYIYGAPILDVSRSHTTTQRSR